MVCTSAEATVEVSPACPNDGGGSGYSVELNYACVSEAPPPACVQQDVDDFYNGNCSIAVLDCVAANPDCQQECQAWYDNNCGG
jgi:hypothetical protein